MLAPDNQRVSITPSSVLISNPPFLHCSIRKGKQIGRRAASWTTGGKLDDGRQAGRPMAA
jgi:hypothetical protein